MLVIDSLLAGTVGLIEDAYLPNSVAPIVRALEKLASEFQVAVVILHHLSTKKIATTSFKAGPYQGFDLKKRSSPVDLSHMVGSEVSFIFFLLSF